jgi:hypothetical protein
VPQAIRGQHLLVALRVTDEHLRHIRVLESQIEGNREVTAALRELEENLVVRIDDSAGETAALVETALTRIEELRGILHRLEGKIDALALSLNSGDGAVRSAQAVRSPSHTIPSSDELDRRLASDEDLGDIVVWWHDTWRGTTRTHIDFSAGSEAAIEALQPENFSDNEVMCFMISMLIGCCGDEYDDGRAIYLRSVWPKLGLDAKMLEPAHAREAMRKYMRWLIAARAALHAQRDRRAPRSAVADHRATARGHRRERRGTCLRGRHPRAPGFRPFVAFPGQPRYGRRTPESGLGVTAGCT